MSTDATTQLLESVLFKFATTEDDELQARIDSGLVNILKLIRDDWSTETMSQLMLVLNHVSKRLAVLPDLQLPVVRLLDLYLDGKDVETKSVSRDNLGLVYISKGFDRLPKEDRVTLAPRLLTAIHSRSPTQQSKLMGVFLQQLGALTAAGDFSGFDGLRTSKANRHVVLEYFLDVMLYSPTSNLTSENKLQPGMSQKAIDRVSGLQTTSNDDWNTFKHAILSFLRASNLFPAAEILHVLLVATTRGSPASLRLAEDLLKSNPVDLENRNLTLKLVLFYLGTRGVPKVPKLEWRNAVSEPVKLRILQLLSSSRLVASQPAVLKVVLDCIDTSSPERTQQNKTLLKPGLRFAKWILSVGSAACMKLITPPLFKGLLTLVFKLRNMKSENVGLALHTLGQVGDRMPALVNTNIKVVELFVDALKDLHGWPEVCLDISEGLHHVRRAFFAAKPEHLRELRAFLLRRADESLSAETLTRRYQLALLQLLNRLFPFGDAELRYLNVRFYADDEMLREEAARGLDITAQGEARKKDVECITLMDSVTIGIKKNANEFVEVYPSFLELMQLIKTKTLKLYNDDEGSLDFFTQLLQFSLQTFKASCDGAAVGENGDDAVVIFAKLAEDCLDFKTNHNRSNTGLNDLRELSAQCLSALLGSSPTMQQEYASSKRLRWLCNFLLHGARGTKTVMTSILATLVLHVSDAEVIALLSDTIAPPLLSLQADGKSGLNCSHVADTNIIEGALFGAGVLLGTFFKRKLASQDAAHLALASNVLAVTICLLNPKLEKSGDNRLSAAACKAIGAVGRYEDGTLLDKKVLTQLVKLTGGVARKRNRLVEEAVDALGLCALGNGDAASRKIITTGLLKMNRLKFEEVHCAVGVTLARIAAGRSFLNDDDIKVDYGDDSTTREMLKTIVTTYAEKGSKVQQAAVCVWLLFVAKLAPTWLDSELVNLLQDAFLAIMLRQRVLTDEEKKEEKKEGKAEENSAPETAAKGLATLYFSADNTTRNALLDNLKAVFFKGGSQLKSQESFSTYKELCTVATDMGQPALFYTFVDKLATKRWASKNRYGNVEVDFSLTTVVPVVPGGESESTQDNPNKRLKLTHLVPTVYRYRFDPNPKIRLVMDGLWKDSFADEKHQIEMNNFESMVEQLVKFMAHSNERHRQAACLALAELVSRCCLADTSQRLSLVKHAQSVYGEAFRALDDVSEAVRTSAVRLVKVVNKICVDGLLDKATQAASPELVRQVLDVLIPVVQDGLEGKVTEVQAISVKMLVSIVKSDLADEFLQPYVGLLMKILLQSLGGLEPSVFSQIYYHTSALNITHAQLESMRVKMSQMSPVHEALEECKKKVDASNFSTVATQVVDVLQISASLPVVSASCELLRYFSAESFLTPRELKFPMNLAERALFVLSERLLVAEEGSMLQKNTAQTIASLCAAHTPLLESHVTFLLDLYSVPQRTHGATDLGRRTGATVLQHLAESSISLSVANPEFFRTTILPFAFIASHDPDNTIKTAWTNVFQLLFTGGVERACTTFREEILAFGCSFLHKSDSWQVRTATLKSFATVLKNNAENVEPTQAAMQTTGLLDILLSLLTGKTLWTGKTALLELFVAYVKLTKDIGIAVDTCRILLTQTGPSSQLPTYQPSVMDTLGTLARAVHDEGYSNSGGGESKQVTLWSEVRDIVYPVTTQAVEDYVQRAALNSILLASCYRCLSTAFHGSLDDEKWLVNVLLSGLQSGVLWSVKTVILDGLTDLFTHSAGPLSALDRERVRCVLSESALQDAKYALVRVKGLHALKAFLIMNEQSAAMVTQLNKMRIYDQEASVLRGIDAVFGAVPVKAKQDSNTAQGDI